MIEESGNVFEHLDRKNYVCITTNGFINKNGLAVMGAGVALQARSRFPKLPMLLAESLKAKGNNVVILDEYNRIIAFPTKNEYWLDSDLELIEKSAKQLKALMQGLPKDAKVFLPRPGVGKGNLNYASEVKPILQQVFGDEDRLVVIDR